jgi:hypothetical protein
VPPQNGTVDMTLINWPAVLKNLFAEGPAFSLFGPLTSRHNFAAYGLTQPLLTSKRFGIVETDFLYLIKKCFEAGLLFLREFASVILIHQPVELLLRSRIQTLQFELRLLELNQVLKTNIQRFADRSNNRCIQFLNWLGGGKAVKTLLIHFEASPPQDLVQIGDGEILLCQEIRQG